MTLVTGDPASMRAAAAQLRFKAETLAGVAATVDSGTAGITYVGDAGDRFRGAIATNSARMRTLVDRIGATADSLLRAADQVELEQRAAATEIWLR